MLDVKAGDLAVYDRAKKRNITEYLKTFLVVKWLWMPSDVIDRLIKSLVASAADYRQSRPEDVDGIGEVTYMKRWFA